MDKTKTFIIPQRSRAIPIVTPPNDSANPAKPQKDIQSQRNGLNETSKQIPRSQLHKPTENGDATSAPTSVQQIPRGEIDRAFDVYAHAFVPASLKVVNKAPAVIALAPDNKQIPFVPYIQSFTPPALPHPARRETDLQDDNQYSTKPPALTAHNYESFFKHYLHEEIYAQYKQSEANKLYLHPASLRDGDPTRLQLEVPGVREDDPLLFPGDIIQLRQLRLCPGTGLPIGMEPWLQDFQRSCEQAKIYGMHAPGFTGYQFDACIETVIRSHELIIVKVNAFSPESMKFNIAFPVQMKRYKSMAEVLPLIQEELTFNNDIERSPRIDSKRAGADRITPPSGFAEKTVHAWMNSMLFPEQQDGVMQTDLRRTAFESPFFDPNLNYEQRKAVQTVIGNRYGDVPFLISGPPGTGKTKTLVEAALQMSRSPKHEAILVCAPSDAAADTLAQRLSQHLGPDKMFRLNAPARTFAEVPENLLMYCYVYQDMFTIPEFRDLMAYQVVVTTCRDASILVSARVTNADLFRLESGMTSLLHPRHSNLPPRPHWTALLMDEAAQAIEPEALIPFSVIVPPDSDMAPDIKPQLIMAGDQYQLGPRTASNAKELRTSLFARLFLRPLYQDHLLSRSKTRRAVPVLTKEILPVVRAPFENLIRNYRSHPSILAVPSYTFYHDSLVPEAPASDSLCAWDGWKGRKWPVLFVKNSSPDDIEKDGGGWFNEGEVTLACQQAKNLVDSGMISEDEICIMSPFSAQVQRLRKVIRSPPFKLWKVNIGPTEAFQGLESRAVIICTTRSKLRFLSHDVSLSRGLVKQPQRMNVALTRAKHGLIVIGNPQILREDPCWRVWMAFCSRNGLEDNRSYTPRLQVEDDGEWEESPEKTLPGPRDDLSRLIEPTRLERILISQEQGDLDSSSGRSRAWGGVTGDVAEAEDAWAQGLAAEEIVLQKEKSGYYEEEENGDGNIEVTEKDT